MDISRTSHHIGLLAEWLCILRLWLTGWRILAVRWRHSSGEIDLIAKRGGIISFIEVKARQSHHRALGAVSLRQQQRISRAAQCWLAQHPAAASVQCRFDVMTLTRWPWPVHLHNAWSVRE